MTFEEVQEENATLKEIIEETTRKGAHRRKRQTAAPVTDDELVLVKAAKHFTVMYHVDVIDPIALLATPVTDTYEDNSRFASAMNAREGLVRELDSLLSEDLKDQRRENAERLGSVVSSLWMSPCAVRLISPSIPRVSFHMRRAISGINLRIEFALLAVFKSSEQQSPKN